MSEEELPALLGRFGLSEKEVDTYLSLLERGEAKASTIAQDANVSKRYVYSVSESLADRGFVEVNDHVVPTTIRARPPEEVVSELQRDVETMQEPLEERYAETDRGVDQFEVVKSRVTVLKRIGSLVEDADAEITLALPAEHLPEVVDELRAAVDRGVLVVLVVSDAEAVPEVDGFASVVRVWEETMPTMLTVDSAVGLVAPAEMLLRSNSDRRAIVFAQEQLAPVIVGSFLGNYWPVAREVGTAPPRSLPATFENFRHAVFEATLHRQAGTEVVARVEGRWTADGEPAEVTGTVVETVQGLLEPATNEFPVEHALAIEADGTTVSVGGQGAFVEDIEAATITLDYA